MKQRRTNWIVVLALGMLCLGSGCATTGEQEIAQPRKEIAMTEFRYGFRFDAVDWSQKDGSLQAAIVRTVALEKPAETDAALISAEIDRILSAQSSDGRIMHTERDGTKNDDTAEKLYYILQLGADIDRSELQRAGDALLASKAGIIDGTEEGEVDLQTLMCLRRLAKLDDEKIRDLVEPHLAQDSWQYPDRGCPWHQGLYWAWLWEFRDLLPVEEPVRASIKLMVDRINSAGTDSKNAPMGLINAAGIVDVPETRELVLRMIPLLIRRQHSDGGWGSEESDVHGTTLGASVSVFRMLKTHDLLGPLSAAPPPPSNTRIISTVPAPKNARYLVHDGDALWTYVQDRKQIAKLANDGKEIQSLTASETVSGIAYGNGSLFVGDNEDSSLSVLDPATGEGDPLELAATKWQVEWVNAVVWVDANAYIYDAWWPWLWKVEADGICHPHAGFLPGSPHALASEGDTIWMYDNWADCLMHSKLDGTLVEYFDNPLSGCIEGLAWDNGQLLVLDAENGQICRLEPIRE